MGDRCQSPIVAARTRPDPRSQRRAADVFDRRGFEGSGGACATLWRRDRAVGTVKGDRCQRVERGHGGRAGREGSGKAGRRADLHIGNHGHAKRRDAHPRKPAHQCKNHGAFPPDAAERQDLCRAADLAHCRHFPADHDPDGRRHGAPGQQIRSRGAGQGDCRGGDHHPQRRARDLSAPARIQGGGGPRAARSRIATADRGGRCAA